jgi:hypothetical protein
MAIFLVDLEFREKAKSLLTSRELAACVFLLLLALMPWSEVRLMVEIFVSDPDPPRFCGKSGYGFCIHLHVGLDSDIGIAFGFKSLFLPFYLFSKSQ